MRLVYGRSPWVDRFPKSRVPAFPRYKGDSEIDVAIVGGGLIGCATAYAFAAAGVRVALFEAERAGQGPAAAPAGWITEEPPATFTDVEKALGRRAARDAWTAWSRAALDFTSLIRRLDL